MSSGKPTSIPVVAVGIGICIAILFAISREFPSVAGVIVVVVVFAFVKVSLRVDQEEYSGDGTQKKRAAQETAAKQKVETARLKKLRLIAEVGAENAARIESAQAAVKRVVASDAARAGWLGDVDFTADIAGITESFRKAHELRKVAEQLSKLDKRSNDDLKILWDAQRAAADLAATATSRIKLIQKCADEAELVDESLRQEREDARTAEQRAELHARLSAILYGIEATPNDHAANSAADSVMARVQAYREIKNQIPLAEG